MSAAVAASWRSYLSGDVSHVPILLQAGDFDDSRIFSLRNFANNIGGNASLLILPEQAIFGNGHVVMVEKNNLQVADLIIAYLRRELRLKRDDDDD